MPTKDRPAGRIGRGGNAARNGWRERAAEARRLRETCVACGRTGVAEVVRGRSRLAGPCECGGRGHQTVEIARALGAGVATVGTYLHDPDRALARQRKTKYRGECADCGGPTDSKATPRCGWCLKGERSPYLEANSPTGFRDHTPRTCGFKGCTEDRDTTLDMGCMCPTHAEYFARLRAEFEASTPAVDDWTDRVFGRDRDRELDHEETALALAA